MEEDPQISEEEAEDREWIESLEYVIENSGRERAAELLRKLRIYSQKKGVKIPYAANTPYVNTISLEDQPPYPGNYEIERNIRSIIRWNAMALVVRANRISDGIGGHIRKGVSRRHGIHRADAQFQKGNWGRKPFFLSSPLAHAGLLGVPDGFDGLFSCNPETL